MPTRTYRHLGAVAALAFAVASCATGENTDVSDVELPDRGRRDLPPDDPDVGGNGDPDVASDSPDLDDDTGSSDAGDLVETDADAVLDGDVPEDDGASGPLGETCGNAPLLGEGTTDGTTAGFANDYPSYGANCGGLGAPGADAVYRLESPPNTTLQASLTPSGGFDAALIVTSSCENVSGLCLEAADDSGAAGVESVTVYNTTGSTLTWFLIVDSNEAGATGSFSVTVVYVDE